jgi:hypothetical protein
MGKKAGAQNRAKIESDSSLRAIEAMIEPRERCRECMTLQVVAHLTGTLRATLMLPGHGA